MARYIDADKIDFSPLKYDFDRARAKVIIMGQPTADVAEVKHGEWMCKDEKGNGVCSNCNRQDNIDPLATHCRYCGAKMDK